MAVSERVRELVEQQVRTAIRNDGLDPLTQPDRFRAVVEQCAMDAWITHGATSEEGDPAFVAREVMQVFAGFGALQEFFEDPTVEEIWLNEPGRVFIARHGRSSLTNVVLSDREVRDLIERMLRVSGRRLDVSSPFVDAVLPDGSRLHVVIPDITRKHWAVNIRRFVVRPRSVDDLVPAGALTTQAADFLKAAVVSGLNILIAGGTQAGKTTLLNALLGSVSSQERIVSCEEVFEIQLNHLDWVAMQTRDASLEGTGEIALRRLIREALRMRPTRLVVGEVRQGEALDLLIAMNSGMPAMATLHANSAREAVTKLCTLPLLAGQNIPGDFVVPTVAGCVDVVVHISTDHSGVRRIGEIFALSGRIENGVIEMAELFIDTGQGLKRGNGWPPHPERFRAAGIDLAHLLGSAETAANGWAA
jgi:pilus assembly protein CpaF